MLLYVKKLCNKLLEKTNVFDVRAILVVVHSVARLQVLFSKKHLHLNKWEHLALDK